MNFVRNPNARWLPSRFHFALGRLVGFVILSAAKDLPNDNVAYTIDREQSTLEAYAISAWFVVTVTCFVAPFVTWWLALPVTLVIIELPLYAAGLLAQAITGRLNQQRVVSVTLLTLLVAASCFFAVSASWIRFVAWFALAIVALNALAAVVMFALRGRVRALEQRCVA